MLGNNNAFAQHEHHQPKKEQEKKPEPKKPVQKPSEKPKPKKESIKEQPEQPQRPTLKPDSTLHDMPMQQNEQIPPPPVMEDDSAQTQEDHSKHEMSEAPMTHAFSLNLPMNRNGSGTAWLPDSTPIYGYMFHSKKWMLMLHGNLFLRYTATDIFKSGSRGESKLSAPNWIMGMAQRKVGNKGLFLFRIMVSADPLTEGGNGYPLLYQSGETWNGKPLVDRQHPHDLVSELALGYTHSFTKDIDLSAYLGYPGEPALGPTAFMHRVSSLPNPDAPLGHHWQDATHILFGVGTLGLRYKIIKAEASIFTGREPGENRYNFDTAKFDSYSFRLSLNPNAYWSLQGSYSEIKSPEALEPEEDIQRITFSAINSMRLGKNKNLNTSAVWGANIKHGGHIENAGLLESALQMNKTTLYGRYEFVQKSTHELNLEAMFNGEEKIFPVHALSLGFNHVFYQAFKTNFAIGAQATFYSSPSELEDLYGRYPLSGQVFLRIYPQQLFIKNNMAGMNMDKSQPKGKEHIPQDGHNEHQH